MPRVPTPLIYAIVVLIWGTTWYAIKFQLGVVAPEISLVYRFGLAAAGASASSHRPPQRETARKRPVMPWLIGDEHEHSTRTKPERRGAVAFWHGA